MVMMRMATTSASAANAAGFGAEIADLAFVHLDQTRRSTVWLKRMRRSA
jgi:hypothetical protein